MSDHSCSMCSKTKAPFQCGVCQTVLCKACAQFPEVDFALLPVIPEELAHAPYCNICYQDKVLPQEAAYTELLARAENIAVFERTQGKETRFIKRNEKPFKIDACADRKELIMRLAFMAAQAGFNGLVDVDITSKKIREGTYQTTIWSGTGVPTNIDPKRLMRDRAIWDNPN